MKKIHFYLILTMALVLPISCQPFEAATPLEATLQPVSTIDLSDVSADVTVYPVEPSPELITTSIVPAEETQAFDPFTDGFILRAKNDLSQHIGINIETIKVLSVEAVEWPDGGLGCGKPGIEYVQVITPGFRIVLEADGKIYIYHADMSNQIILCNEKPPIQFSPTP